MFRSGYDIGVINSVGAGMCSLFKITNFASRNDKWDEMNLGQ